MLPWTLRIDIVQRQRTWEASTTSAIHLWSNGAGGPQKCPVAGSVHVPSSPNCAFGGNPGCRAARPTDYGDAQLRQQITGGSASSYAADPGSALPRTHTCGRRIEWLIWLGARSVKNATDAHGPLNDR